MNRKASYVRFHTGLYSPGVAGDLGNVLPSHSKSIDNLDMTLIEPGLVVTGLFNGIPLELFIPHGNIVMAALEAPRTKLKAVANGRP